MQKTKAKRDSRIQMLPFALVWAVSIAIAGLVSGALMRLLLFPLLPNEGVAIADNIIPVIVMGLVQVALVERLLKRSMRGWMLYTSISGLVTLFLIHVVAKSYMYDQNPNFSVELYMLVNYIAYYISAPLLQFFWLRQHVKRAGLWLAINILFTSMIALKGFLSSDYASYFPWIEVFAYSIIQASLMHYMWTQPKDAEKAKIDHAAREQSDHERLERLQERENGTPLWDRGDDPALQREA